MFSLDKCVPICISCVKKEVVNENGTVNENKLKTMCQRLDKPFYSDELDSAFLQQKRENGYLSDDEVAKCGEKIVGFYFKNINTLRQNKDKSFVDSENDGFIHKTVNVIAQNKKEQTLQRYSDITGNEKSACKQNEKLIVWSDQDKQNKQYAIEVVGYDPFEEYPEEGRKFLFNQLSPYLEDDSNADDAYKLSQILQIIKNNYQIDICDKKMSQLDPLKDAESIKTLSDIKNKLVQSNDKIAKENEISVKNRSNKDAGKSTLTYLMRDLREKDFDKAEADYYDQLRGVGSQWATGMSIKAIKENGIFDENDKKEVYEMQLDMIATLNKEVDELKEKIRILTLENDRLKAGVG
ncbi:hypothetical protein AMURIS_04984 [Acetatifactor muris]|uniref:Uncharacterized protein n=2 Tax=Acetatifactor muris TaxID=879566 RepID=A0A2K4ZP80_9FIRM|nr:hypothetical protein [Acetatifactor muris]SOY32226.1 hypothetical protein AMURIS_04984 [Acetatifactor muris]